MSTKRLMMAYTPMNYNVVGLIRQDPTYKKMTADDVLRMIMNYEMYIQEANNIKNLYKGILRSKKQDIALKASKSKKKKVLIERPSNEEEEEKDKEEDNEREYDEDGVTLFIKKFNKFIKKRRPYKRERKEKPRSKRVCYNCSKNGHFIAQCPYERKEEDNDKRKKFEKATRKKGNIVRISLMVKLMFAKNGTQVMRVPSRKVMKWQP
jgi:hypothetical protein